LDADDYFDPNILLVLTAQLDANSNYAFAFSDYYLVDESGRVFAHEWREKLFEVNHVFDVAPNGACCLIRKRVFKEVNFYREDLGAQDGYDLFNKILNSYLFCNVNLPLFYYRRHSTNLTGSTQRILTARRKIMRDSVVNQIEDHRPISLFIPCRRNYDFAQDLWNADLNGKTLLERELEKALPSKLFDHIIVACDNPSAKQIVDKFCDERIIFHLRRQCDTIRSASLALTLDSIFSIVDPARLGATVISYPQAPFVTLDSLEEAFYTLAINNSDAAMGVLELSSPLYRRDSHGLTQLNPSRGFKSDFDAIYMHVNTAQAFKNRNIAKGSLGGPFVVHFPMQKNESLFINTSQSLRIASILLSDQEAIDSDV